MRALRMRGMAGADRHARGPLMGGAGGACATVQAGASVRDGASGRGRASACGMLHAGDDRRGRRREGGVRMYRIKEFAAMTGLPPSKIRFYEKHGLLATRREENGYRVFSPEDAFRANAFRVLLQYGFTVEQAVAMLDAEQGTDCLLYTSRLPRTVACSGTRLPFASPFRIPGAVAPECCLVAAPPVARRVADHATKGR